MKSDKVLLIHIKNEMVFLQRIAKGRTLDDLVHDDYFSHAVRSAIEVIGEALKKYLPCITGTIPCDRMEKDVPDT